MLFHPNKFFKNFPSTIRTCNLAIICQSIIYHR